jgi:hypothetical protein
MKTIACASKVVVRTRVGCSSVVEHSSSMHEALNLILSTANKTKQNNPPKKPTKTKAKIKLLWSK